MILIIRNKNKELTRLLIDESTTIEKVSACIKSYEKKYKNINIEYRTEE